MTSPKVAKHETRKIAKLPAPPQVFEDHLAVEEPLEIRIHDEPVVITLRTPGEDLALAVGLLYAEGLIHSAKDIGTLRHGEDGQGKNVVNITYSNGHKPDPARLRRNLLALSSCGVCGRSAIDQMKFHAKPIQSKVKVRLDAVYGFGHSLRKAHTLVEKTGGLQAAGIFDEHGVLHTLHEDVGRHNAVDKAVGHMLLQGKMPLDHHILMVSGRASFEIIQRAVMARTAMVIAVSAPSSLAVETAREFGITLVGFLREDDFNVYTHAERIEV